MGKKGRNGFFEYLIHTQKQLRSQGKDLSVNSPELQAIAGDKWKVMSKEERQPFEGRSRRETQAKTIPITPKPMVESRENVGRLLSQRSAEIDDDFGHEDYCDKMINSCVKACKTREDLMNASFFIIGTNVMCKTDANEYPPLEIGICQYSIASGIQYTYHEFIDAGSVQLGYMHISKSWSEDKHKIPLSHFLPAVKDYPKIVEDIQQILEESRFMNELTGNPTPMLVFCLEEAIDQNVGVFEWLANKYRASTLATFEWDLEVLDISTLLFHLSKSQNKLIPPAAGEDMLTSSTFDYSANTNCPFHEEQDNKWCAQGLARRLCYLMSLSLKDIFDITPSDAHIPPHRDNVITETYVANLQEVKSMSQRRYHFEGDVDDNWAPSDNRSAPGPSSGHTPRPSGIGRGRGFPKN